MRVRLAVATTLLAICGAVAAVTVAMSADGQPQATEYALVTSP